MRRPARWWRAVLVLLVVAGCGGDEGDEERAQKRVSEHLDILEALPLFQQTPAFAKFKSSGRRDECHEPDFERREPTTWREYTYEGTAAQVLGFYGDALRGDGWQQADGSEDPAAFGQVRFTKDFGGWAAAFSVGLLRDGRYEVAGEDSSSQVCPSG